MRFNLALATSVQSWISPLKVKVAAALEGQSKVYPELTVSGERVSYHTIRNQDILTADNKTQAKFAELVAIVATLKYMQKNFNHIMPYPVDVDPLPVDPVLVIVHTHHHHLSCVFSMYTAFQGSIAGKVKVELATKAGFADLRLKEPFRRVTSLLDSFADLNVYFQVPPNAAAEKAGDGILTVADNTLRDSAVTQSDLVSMIEAIAELKDKIKQQEKKEQDLAWKKVNPVRRRKILHKKPPNKK